MNPFDKLAIIPKTDSRLGRNLQHDPRSLQYAMGLLPKGAIKSVRWNRAVPVFDQGNLGSCVGNTAAGWVVTDNALRKGLSRIGDKAVNEDFAIELYSLATQLDEFEGEYLPVDKGSSGLGGAKALQSKGLISSYSHAFSVDALFSGLQSGPAMVGVIWFNSMFNVDTDGHIQVQPASGTAGGHEFLIDQIDVAPIGAVERVWLTNSWGGWGINGRGWFTADEIAFLLGQNGDVVFPIAPVEIYKEKNQTSITKDELLQVIELIKKLKRDAIIDKATIASLTAQLAQFTN